MSIKDLVYIALFTVIMIVLGIMPPIMLPIIAVPITAQSMGAMLAGAILGAKKGFLSVLLFIFLVALGMPFLAGGRGGLGIILGPTGGFIIGYCIAAFVIGFLFNKCSKRGIFWEISYLAIGGILVLYTIGISYLSFITEMSLTKAFMVSIIFIPGDLVKIYLAYIVRKNIQKLFPDIIEN